MLLLSRFTGSAEEIDGAVLINPFNVDGFVSAIRTALEMPAEERRRRMHRMRRRLQNNTIFDWLDSILARSADIMAAQPPASGVLAPDDRARMHGTHDASRGAIGTRLDGSPLAVLLDIDGTLAPIAPTPERRRESRDDTVSRSRRAGRAPVHTWWRSCPADRLTDARRMAGATGHGSSAITVSSCVARTATLIADRRGRAFEDAIAAAAHDLASLAPDRPGAIRRGQALDARAFTIGWSNPEALPRIARAHADVAASSSASASPKARRSSSSVRPSTSTRERRRVAFARTRGRAWRRRVGVVRRRRSHRRRRVPRAATRSRTRRHRCASGAPDDDRRSRRDAEFVLASPEELRELLEWLVARERERAGCA